MHSSPRSLSSLIWRFLFPISPVDVGAIHLHGPKFDTLVVLLSSSLIYNHEASEVEILIHTNVLALAVTCTCEYQH